MLYPFLFKCSLIQAMHKPLFTELVLFLFCFDFDLDSFSVEITSLRFLTHFRQMFPYISFSVSGGIKWEHWVEAFSLSFLLVTFTAKLEIRLAF